MMNMKCNDANQHGPRGLRDYLTQVLVLVRRCEPKPMPHATIKNKQVLARSAHRPSFAKKNDWGGTSCEVLEGTKKLCKCKFCFGRWLGSWLGSWRRHVIASVSRSRQAFKFRRCFNQQKWRRKWNAPCVLLKKQFFYEKKIQVLGEEIDIDLCKLCNQFDTINSYWLLLWTMATACLPTA